MSDSRELADEVRALRRAVEDLTAIVTGAPPAAAIASLEPSMTPKDVAELAGLSYWAVLRDIKDGKLRASKLRGQWRVQRDAYMEWIGAGTHQAVERRAPRPPKRSTGPAQAGSLASLRALERRGAA